MLTRDQVEQYRREGCLVVEGLIAAETLAALRRVTDETVATARGITNHTKVLDLEPSHAPERPRVRRIKNPRPAHPFYRDMAGHPPVMAVYQGPLYENQHTLGRRYFAAVDEPEREPAAAGAAVAEAP